jgi:hypothetical protein
VPEPGAHALVAIAIHTQVLAASVKEALRDEAWGRVPLIAKR